MSRENTNGARSESLAPLPDEFPFVTADSTAPVLIWAPACLGCPVESACADRKQPMCGGHTVIGLNSPEGRRYARKADILEAYGE